MINKSELYHHGILGQQWGIRHGPPYPLQEGKGDVTIKKGTKLHRLSMNKENKAKGHAYVTYLNSDTKHYRGFFGARLKAMNKNATVYSLDLEAANDLKAPSKEKRVETFLELYKEDPVIGKELGSYYKDDWHNHSFLPRKYYETKFSKLDQEKLETKGYDTFVRALGGNEYIRGEYFNKLSDKGYNFVTDDMDAGRFGKEPSIVFDREKDLYYVGENVLSGKEIAQTWKEEGTYMYGSSSKSKSKKSSKRA